MNAQPPTSDILLETRGRLGVITLNRPQALNALNLSMIQALRPCLDAWAVDPAIAAVVIRGAGDRAFCAGGDVRAVYDSGLAAKRGQGDGALTREFFRLEYQLNRAIKQFPKPYIALLDGITMGGGVGLSVHGQYRVATERLVFAMPETGIGLFPDVGGTWFLPRCPGRIGTWLALTGHRLGGADALYAGIATHTVRSADLDRLITDLADSQDEISAVLARATTDLGGATLPDLQAVIDRCFAADTVPAICDALAIEGGEWAEQTLAGLRAMSPTSLKVTLHQMRLGAGLSFDDCMRTEFRVVRRMMQGHDFYEGIRAVLVDKDRNPKWSPDRLDAVTDADVAAYFAPTPNDELTFTS